MQRLIALFVCLALSLSATGYAGPASKGELDTINTASFLNAHPDMKYRLEGWAAFDDGRYDDALGHFVRASNYADKVSQAMLAQMHWEGKGIAIDRALAYAWSDLAAERGYPRLVAQRERYWSELDPAERMHALEAGKTLYAEYGDEVAKPRMAMHLRKAYRSMVGKRPRRDAEIFVPDANGDWISIPGRDFYAAKFWEPERYQEWVDQTWAAPPRGNVRAGELEPVEE